MKSFLYILIVLGVIVSAQHVVNAAGCSSDAQCTSLCGFAGAGTCVNGSYCTCAKCPQRGLDELAHLPQVCTLDPTCLCPTSSMEKFYTGHRCLQGLTPVCICYCMPLTLQSFVGALKCPFPIPGTS